MQGTRACQRGSAEAVLGQCKTWIEAVHLWIRGVSIYMHRMPLRRAELKCQKIRRGRLEQRILRRNYYRYRERREHSAQNCYSSNNNVVGSTAIQLCTGCHSNVRPCDPQNPPRLTSSDFVYRACHCNRISLSSLCLQFLILCECWNDTCAAIN